MRTGLRPDGKRPLARRPDGLWAGAHLRTAGYAPAGMAGDGRGHPRWPQIVLACPDGVNPAARPDPAHGDVMQLGAGHVVVR